MGKTAEELKDIKREYDKQYRLKNSEKIKARVIKHRLDNLEHYLQKGRDNHAVNKERDRQLARKWYKENKAYSHAIELNRYHTDPITKLKSAIRVGLGRALNYANVDKEHSSIVYLGCGIDVFKQHIEKQFKEGMSWDNHGEWHLDHIKPLANLTDTEDVVLLKELCHYTNYQPLWKEENLSKYSNGKES